MATKTLSGDGWRVTADEETFELVIDARPGCWGSVRHLFAAIWLLGCVALLTKMSIGDEPPPEPDFTGVVMLTVVALAFCWFQRELSMRVLLGDETLRVFPDRFEQSWGTKRRRVSVSNPRAGQVVILAEPMTFWERAARRRAWFMEFRRCIGNFGQLAVHCPASGYSSRLGTELSVKQAQALIDACRAADLPTRGLRFTPFDVWPPPRAGS